MTVLKTLKFLHRLFKGRKFKVVTKWGTIIYYVQDILAIGDEGAEYFQFIYTHYDLIYDEAEIEARDWGEDELVMHLEEAAQQRIRYWLGQKDLVAGFNSLAEHLLWDKERKKYPFLMDIRILYGTEGESTTGNP
jgi:hypothetical protein